MGLIEYDNDGRIIRVLQANKETIAINKEHSPYSCMELLQGESENIHGNTHYMEGGKVLGRPVINTIHKVDGFLLTFWSLPPGTNVTTTGVSLVTDNETTELEFLRPQLATIQILPPFPYQGKTVKVQING